MHVRVLEVRDACPERSIDPKAQGAGDSPAVAGIFVVGAISVILGLWVDPRFRPPLGVHALLRPALVLPVMRLAKAAPAGLHHRHRQGI